MRTRSGSASLLSILLTRDHDRDTSRLGVLNGFDGLRHDAVVGRHHQHTTTSVAFAPRARIAVNAAWPGVSRKVTMPFGVST